MDNNFENYSDSTYEKAFLFDFYLNKTIYLASKYYYKKKSNIEYYEYTYDMVNYDEEIDDLVANVYALTSDELTNDNELENTKLIEAIGQLSDIEQKVLQLIFSKKLKRTEAARILNMCDDAITRAKQRAIKKLKKYFEEDNND